MRRIVLLKKPIGKVAFSMSSNVTADRTKNASGIAAAFPSSE